VVNAKFKSKLAHLDEVHFSPSSAIAPREPQDFECRVIRTSGLTWYLWFERDSTST
jgi:hypothetical protein